MTTLLDATQDSLEPDRGDFSASGIGLGITVAVPGGENLTGGTVPGALAVARAGVLNAMEDAIERDSYVEWTMEGAPQAMLYVRDPQRKILNSGVFDYAISMTLDGIQWHLVHVDYDDEQRRLNLTFEHWIVSLLRQDTTPIKASRDSMTRAQFIFRMVREIPFDTRFVSPQLTVRQRIAAPKNTPPTSKRARTRHSFPAATRIMIGNAAATREQLHQAARLLGVAADEKAGPLAVLSMMCAGLGESRLRAIMNQGGSGYGGVLQGDVTAHNHYFNVDDTEQMARCFLRGGKGFQGGGAIYLARKHPDWTPGKIAMTIEGSRANFASDAEGERFYEKWRTTAQAIIHEYTGGGDSFAVAGGGSYWKKYEFTRGVPGVTHEDSWGAGLRLAREVRWRFFIVGRRSVYYVTDNDLLKIPPAFAITASTEGYVNVSFGVEVGGRYVVRHGQKTARPSEATLTVRADRLALHPGQNVVLAADGDDGFGPGGGQWIIDSTRRPIFDSLTEVNLRRALDPLPEPRSELVQRSKKKGKPGASSQSSYAPPPGHGTGEFAVLVKDLTYVGPDQGIDFTGTGTIYAPCDLRITRVVPSASDPHSGWMGGAKGQDHVVAGRILSNNPPGSYAYIYFAEAVQPVSGLRVGDTLSAGDPIATLNSKWPGCEIGFAQDGHGSPYGTTQDGKAGGPTPVHGQTFRDWIAKLSRDSKRQRRHASTPTVGPGNPIPVLGLLPHIPGID